ncbi:MAG: hypothetical protein L3J97_03100 [Thermoplasmata archaeon]|nr:hypothetical protein [Thermoplasmata archaeon]
MTRDAGPLPIDSGLLDRFLEAERGVEWQPVVALRSPGKPGAGRRSGKSARGRAANSTRLAYYHDETARVQLRSSGADDVLTVTSGPVGALVLVGECTRRGSPTGLRTCEAGVVPGFPEGAIEARWDANSTRHQHALPFADVVKLARYALA